MKKTNTIESNLLNCQNRPENTYKDRVPPDSPQSLDLLLGQAGSLLALLQLLLRLAELGQVEGGNLLRLLNLLLVRLDLSLELIDESLHPLVVLPVLVLLVGQLLDVPLRLAQVLKSINI